jgi:hypothetical protein
MIARLNFGAVFKFLADSTVTRCRPRGSSVDVAVEAQPAHGGILRGEDLRRMPVIEQLSNFPENVVAIVARGRVTKADYNAVLAPAVRDALEKHDKVRIYYEIAPDFTGFDPGAIWEDFRVGMEHLTRWERVALVTDVEWIKQTMQFFSFMMPGDTKSFPTAQADQARDWIVAQ